MDLYKREGVNPFGGLTGCLPLLAQFPILIGFYNMLTVAVELRGAPFFGWIQDLSHPDPFWVTPMLMGGTMFVQQKMADADGQGPAAQQQHHDVHAGHVHRRSSCSCPADRAVLVREQPAGHRPAVAGQPPHRAARGRAARRRDRGTTSEFEGKDLEEALARGRGAGSAAESLRLRDRRGGAPRRLRARRVAPDPDSRCSRSHGGGGRSPARERPPARRSADAVRHPGAHARARWARADGRAPAPRRAALELELDGGTASCSCTGTASCCRRSQFVLSRMARRRWPDAAPSTSTARARPAAATTRLWWRGCARLAEQVLRTRGRQGDSAAMNPYERRLVHMTVREFPGSSPAPKATGP